MARSTYSWSRYAAHHASAALAVIGLAGCGGLGQDRALPIAAPSLCEAIPGQAMDATGTCKPEAEVPLPSDKIDRLGRVVLESEYQCERFMNNLVLTATGSHLWLDGAATVFSALGTAFTPISTVHALTAATTV